MNVLATFRNPMELPIIVIPDIDVADKLPCIVELLLDIKPFFMLNSLAIIFYFPFPVNVILVLLFYIVLTIVFIVQLLVVPDVLRIADEPLITILKVKPLVFPISLVDVSVY